MLNGNTSVFTATAGQVIQLGPGPISSVSFAPGVTVTVIGILTTTNDVTIGAGALVTLQCATLVVRGNLNIQSGHLYIDICSFVTVSKNFVLSAASKLTVVQHPNGQVPITVGGTFQLNGNFVTVVTQAFPGSGFSNGSGQRKRDIVTLTQQPTVATSSAVTGTFTNTTAQLSQPGAQCQTLQSAAPATTATSVSVIVTVQQNTDLPGCNPGGGGGLSTGAIVGIVVGSVVFCIIVVTLLILFFRRKELRERAVMFNKQMKERTLDGTKSTNSVRG